MIGSLSPWLLARVVKRVGSSAWASACSVSMSALAAGVLVSSFDKLQKKIDG